MSVSKSHPSRLQDAYALPRQFPPREDELTKLEHMFCPPLDTALVAAIWGDTREFGISVEVLAELAGQAEATEKQQAEEAEEEEEEEWMTEIDELVYKKVANWNFQDSMKPDTLTSARPLPKSGKTVSETPVDFLRTCFPFIETTELEKILAENNDDLVQAVDIVLKDINIREQNEGSSNSGSSSTSSPLDDTASSSSISVEEAVDWNDETGADGFTEGGLSSKKLRKRERRHQRQRKVIWESNPVLRYQKDLHGEDELFYPPPPTKNQWTSFNQIVDRLTNLFPYIPRTTITSVLHRHHGSLENAADELLSIAIPDPGRRSQTSLEKEVDQDLSRAITVFPETQVDELRRAIVRGKVKGSTFEEIVEKILEQSVKEDEKNSDLTSRSSKTVKSTRSIPLTNEFLPSGVQLNLDNGEFVFSKVQSKSKNPRTITTAKSAQRAAAMPIIPNYLRGDHSNKIDPHEARRKEQECFIKRDELYRKAAHAYQRAKNKGNTGEAGIAFYYSAEGREMDTLARQWGQRAAHAYVREASERANDDHLVDLHGLTVNEARDVVSEGVNQWWSRSSSSPKPLKIVTGVGLHSAGGTSKLYPAIVRLLNKEGWELDLRSKGAIFVTGVKEKKKY